MLRGLLYTVALLAAEAKAAHASPGERVSGPARVVDGDTLDLGGRRIRFHAIDAFETGQHCYDTSGTPWDCAGWATDLLTQVIGGRSVTCTHRAVDRYGRTVAMCSVAGKDLGAFLVRSGAALAHRRYGRMYVSEERQARHRGYGVWSGRFTPPWAHRSDDRTVGQPPPGCAIKGNISRNGRIYHLPGQRDYGRTRIDPNQGERWFCSEADAEFAGWRRAKR